MVLITGNENALNFAHTARAYASAVDCKSQAAARVICRAALLRCLEAGNGVLFSAISAVYAAGVEKL